MNASRQIALSVALSLLLPGFALAGTGSGDSSASDSQPINISQNLPPIQGPGYSTPVNNGPMTNGNGTDTSNGNSGNSNSYGNYGGSNSGSNYGSSSNYGSNSGGGSNYGSNSGSGYGANSSSGGNNYGSTPNYSQQQPSYSQYSPGYQSQSPLQGYVATAPAGTVVSANLSSPISSEFARVGDRFTATLSSPVTAGSNVILPAGSQMEGQVMMVKAAGHTGRNGELDIRFTSATLPNGQRVPLSARIKTDDGTGIIKGGTTGGRVGRAAMTTGVGAGLGAALGTAMGPLSGGGVGRGAIYGTVLGAGLGALGSAWQKGKPATVDSSQPISVVLDQPLTATPSSSSGGSDYSQQGSGNYYPNNGGQSTYQQYGGQQYGGQQTPQPNNFYGGQ